MQTSNKQGSVVAAVLGDFHCTGDSELMAVEFGVCLCSSLVRDLVWQFSSIYWQTRWLRSILRVPPLLLEPVLSLVQKHPGACVPFQSV